MSRTPQIGNKSFWTTHFFTRMWEQHEQHLVPLLDCFHTIEAQSQSPIASGIAPKAKATRGLYESHFDLFKHPPPALDALKVFIVETIQYVVSYVNGSTVSPSQIEVELADGWFHITRDGGFHDAHYHSACSWCGIYYLSLGDMSRDPGDGAPNGLNRFYSPINFGGAYRDFGNKYLEQSIVDVPARAGMLLLFPSYLLHSGLPYFGKHERVVISFNSRSFLKSASGETA